jgi:feruloyl esterase
MAASIPVSHSAAARFAYTLALLVITAPFSRLDASGSAACSALADQQLPNTTITSAEENRSGTVQAVTGLLPFCRVIGLIQPTPQSEIRFQVWLPLEQWNGKFSAVGNPGWGGGIMVNAPNGGQGGGLVGQLRRGYAVAANNTGHPSGTGLDAARFGHDAPERLVDFAWRAHHETAVVAKRLVEIMYGRPPAHSYFIGNSSGGYQGLMEAQRFPDDFDGIVAGAPTNNWTRQMAAGLDGLLAFAKAPADVPATRIFEILRRGVMSACDGIDGNVDGLILDPRRCTFDPVQLLCSPQREADCLTESQVAAARRVYAGFVDPRSGTKLFPGLSLGSEGYWGESLDPQTPNATRLSYWQWLVFADPAWNWRTFSFDTPAGYEALQKSERQLGPIMNAVNPDLTAFRRRGGKLIVWHGWSDQRVPPLNSIEYHADVQRVFANSSGGSANIDNFYRLFLIPGLAHDVAAFDFQTALENWVERGVAPELVAAPADPGVDPRRTAVCSFPLTIRQSDTPATAGTRGVTCEPPR